MDKDERPPNAPQPGPPRDGTRRAFAGLVLALTFPMVMLGSEGVRSGVNPRRASRQPPSFLPPVEVVRADFPVPEGVNAADADRWYRRGYVWQLGSARTFLPRAYAAPPPSDGSRTSRTAFIDTVWTSREGAFAYNAQNHLWEAARSPLVRLTMQVSGRLANHDPERFSLLDLARTSGYRGPPLNHVENNLSRPLRGTHDSFIVTEMRETEAPWTPGRSMLRVMQDAGGLVFVNCSQPSSEGRPEGQDCVMRLVRPDLLLEVRYPSVLNHAEVHQHVSRLHAAMRLTNA